MKKHKLTILAIETSCDETAASVVEAEINPHLSSLITHILSNVIASQIDLHKQYGGVYPEIASRAHTEKIIAVVEQASACCKPDVIAVTTGPGLIGSLLVGVNCAKTLAYTTGKPIVGINHWLGHIYSNWSSPLSIPIFPSLILIASGGHTGLVLMKSHRDIQTIGETLDDAAGEAFDKVAKILGLGYPGGPAISKAASKARGLNIKFPRSMLDRDDFNFSFSGLKTAVLYKVKELLKYYKLSAIRDMLAYEFQQTVIDILIGKTLQAAREFHPKSICLCGGVSANKELREQLKMAVEKLPSKPSYHIPPMNLTTDNAAMIGITAAYQDKSKWTTFDKISANSNQKL